MVNETIDHVMAIVIVGVLFTGAILILPSLSYLNLQTVDQQQLRNMALNVYNELLLDTGTPTNWGSLSDFRSNDPRVLRFGLASAEDSRFYVLDPDKVQRLVVGNPLGEIEYSTAKQLLGLEGYEFNLKIIPPFNVTFSSVSVVGDTLSYRANVFYLDGSPIPNAKAYAKAIYSKGSTFNVSQSGPVETTAMGVCIGNVKLSVTTPDFYVVTLRVTVADVATLIVTSKQYFENNICNVNIVGDEVILTTTKEPPYNQPPNENVWIMNILAIDSQGTIWDLYRGTKSGQDNKFNSGAGAFELWRKEFVGLHGSDPVLMVFNFWAIDPITGNGRQMVIVTLAYPNLLGNTIFSYGVKPLPSKAVVNVQRSVTISGMTYTSELWLCKES